MGKLIAKYCHSQKCLLINSISSIILFYMKLLFVRDLQIFNRS